jgi:hypothetical protein
MEAHPHFRSIDPAAPSQPFLTCCFAQKADFCLLIKESSRTELVFAVAPSDVAAFQNPVQTVRHELAIHHQVVSDLASSFSPAT